MLHSLTNYTVNYNPTPKHHRSKCILSWVPYSKGVYRQIAKNNGTTEQALKETMVHSRDLGVQATKYFDLPTEVMEEYAQTLDKLTGARRWFAPKKTSDCLSTIMSGVLFIVQGVQSAHIGHIFDTGDVLYDASTIPASVPLPAGFFGTAVQRKLPCKSTGYIIGNNANVAESTLLVTLEHIPTLQNPARYNDIVQLAHVYKALSWCPALSVKSLESGVLQVVYPEDDGSVMDVLRNRHVGMRHLEVYIYRDLLRYIFDLARAGYSLTKWSDADWRISQWNVPSRQIILVSVQHLELLPQSTPEECFLHSLDILLEMFIDVATFRDAVVQQTNYTNFRTRLLSGHNRDHLYHHLQSLYKQQCCTLVEGYVLIRAMGDRYPTSETVVGWEEDENPLTNENHVPDFFSSPWYGSDVSRLYTPDFL